MESLTNSQTSTKDQMEYFSTLSTGTAIPNLGFGTYKLENIGESIENAIKIGYRLFDTAKFYENEEQIGKAINKCISDGLVKRSELFISTKLWMDDLNDPEKALRAVLQRMNLDYIDVYFYHWPLPFCEEGEIKKMYPLHETWKKLEKCVELNLTKSLGISNFNVQLIMDLFSYAKIKPTILQVELHPVFSQPKLREFCKRFGIRIMAYNPILRGASSQRDVEFDKFNLFNNEIILNLAQKYNKSITQIILNWHLRNNIIAIPKSSNYEHQKENFESLFYKMDEEDYSKIDNLNLGKRFNFSEGKPFSAGIEVFI